MSWLRAFTAGLGRQWPLALLLFACVHEFAWQLVPDHLFIQRDVRDITQWGLVLALAWLLHLKARNRLASAVCAAVAVMSSTTAGCAAWWLFVDDAIRQCSRTWQAPIMLLSAFAALAVFWSCTHGNRRAP
jgi:hypothetical protein